MCTCLCVSIQCALVLGRYILLCLHCIVHTCVYGFAQCTQFCLQCGLTLHYNSSIILCPNVTCTMCKFDTLCCYSEPVHCEACSVECVIAPRVFAQTLKHPLPMYRHACVRVSILLHMYVHTYVPT